MADNDNHEPRIGDFDIPELTPEQFEEMKKCPYIDIYVLWTEEQIQATLAQKSVLVDFEDM